MILLISFSSAYELEFYHSDHLGSPVLVTDESGAVQWSSDYDVFGEAVNEEGDGDLGYNQKEKDDTGLLYYGARYYNAELGRFITADTVKGSAGSLQSQNLYVYVQNNPMKYIDPTGNQQHPSTLSDAEGVCRDKSYYFKFLLENVFHIPNKNTLGHFNSEGVSKGREHDLFKQGDDLVTYSEWTSSPTVNLLTKLFMSKDANTWTEDFENEPTNEQLERFNQFESEMKVLASELFAKQTFVEMNPENQKTVLNKIMKSIDAYIPVGSESYNYERANNEESFFGSIASGIIQGGDAPPNHGWNTIMLSDGSRVIMDLTNYDVVLEEVPRERSFYYWK